MKWKLAALSAYVLILAGCASGPTLVGKWTGNVPGGQGSAEVEFMADNNMAMTFEGMGQKMIMKGVYKADAKELAMTMKDVELPGMDKTKADKFKQFLSAGLNKEEKLKISFNGNDEVTLVPEKTTATSQPLKLTRKK